MRENSTQHDAEVEVRFTSNPYFRGRLRGPLNPIIMAIGFAIVTGSCAAILHWFGFEASIFGLIATVVIGSLFFQNNWSDWHGRFMPFTILGDNTQSNTQPNMQSQNNPYSISFGWPSLLKDESGGSSGILYPFPYPNVDDQEVNSLLRELQKKGEEISIDLLPSLKLVKPIHPRLSYDKEGKQFVVDHTELDVYGAGSDEWEAVKDFKSTLEDAYYNLKKDRKNLGPRLREQWQYFQQIIKES